MVIASYLLDKAREKGYAQGYAESYPVGYAHGLAEGRAEGRAEAYEDANKQLDAYFERMDAVREKGEDFNEPPPMFGNNRR